MQGIMLKEALFFCVFFCLSTKMLLIYICLVPFGKNDGNSWFHAAVGKPGFHGISMFLISY